MRRMFSRASNENWRRPLLLPRVLACCSSKRYFGLGNKTPVAAMETAPMSATKRAPSPAPFDRCASVAAAVQYVQLLPRRIGPHRIDAAALVGAARGGHALLIG